MSGESCQLPECTYCLHWSEHFQLELQDKRERRRQLKTNVQSGHEHGEMISYLSAASWSSLALLSALDADVRSLVGSEKKRREQKVEVGT